jgi:hypothetical protein
MDDTPLDDQQKQQYEKCLCAFVLFLYYCQFFNFFFFSLVVATEASSTDEYLGKQSITWTTYTMASLQELQSRVKRNKEQIQTRRELIVTLLSLAGPQSELAKQGEARLIRRRVVELNAAIEQVRQAKSTAATNVCQKCYKIFDSPTSLAMHRRNVHGEIVEIPQTCPVCKQVLPNGAELVRHRKEAGHPKRRKQSDTKKKKQDHQQQQQENDQEEAAAEEEEE